MELNMIKVSVIVPIYNVYNWLEECLESLLKQRLLECEFICVDDGSLDDSYQIVERYVEKDKRFKLIRQENKGQAEARNTGIRKATGRYIAFLDSDDYFAHEDVLEKLFREAEEHQLEIISFETELLYEGNLKEKDNKDFYYYKKHAYPGIRKGKDFLGDMMSNHEYCDSVWLLFIKHKWLLEEGISFYPGIVYEDALFCMNCFLRAERMMHLSEKFYTYRVRENSTMTSSIRWENVRSRIVVYREILRLLFSYGRDDIKLQEAITEYLASIASHIKCMDGLRVDESSESLLEPLDILLIETMELRSYCIEANEKMVLDGLKKFVEGSEGIILYGAGKIGRLFFHFLEDKGLGGKVLCYAVSKEPDKGKVLDNVPILFINEAIKHPGEVVLAVIDYCARNEMKNNLKQLGVEKFQIFDHYICRALRNYARISDTATK